MRQACGQRRKDEAIDAENAEHPDREQDVVMTGRDDNRETDDEHGPDEVGVDQDIATAPPIEEDPDERPDQRVRQEQDRKRDGDLRSGRLSLRGEQHERRQGRLQQAITGLACEAGTEQETEAAHAEHIAQPHTGVTHVRTVSLRRPDMTMAGP